MMYYFAGPESGRLLISQSCEWMGKARFSWQGSYHSPAVDSLPQAEELKPLSYLLTYYYSLLILESYPEELKVLDKSQGKT